ncbi:MAG: MarR family transcriptional regulator [Spirochaetia bacterium]|nr:MarR family transcriptional regulator [Spirochaetia bacterium]
MHQTPQVGLTIKTLSHLLFRSMTKTLKLDHSSPQTVVQSHILGYFAHSSRSKIEQKELQKHLCIRRSSMTNILNTMEAEQLIERVGAEYDKRQNLVILTDKAKDRCTEHLLLVKEFETVLRKGITEEELEHFFIVTEKMKQNLETLLCCEN